LKEQITITKDKIIRDIAKQTNKNIYDIRTIYNVLEDYIFNSLSSVDENKDVIIKLFEGISLEGTYACEKTKKNNLTGEASFVESKIKPKFKITRYYNEKLNKY
jgi:nucleoid DNA-binding protein